MKAIVQRRFGGPEVLELADVDVPAVRPDDVLLRVRAASADPGVWHLMLGRPYVIRLAVGLRRPKVSVPGSCVAGVVEQVGANVTDFTPGDAAFGTGSRVFAEFVTVPADRLVPIPNGMTFEEAAAVPVSAVTALQGLRDVGKVKAGESVLVIGAGGGVGSFAVQIAKAFGATVTGVCSTAKVPLVRSLGAEHVIDYTRQRLDEDGRRYDVIVDTAGNRSLGDLRRILAPRGTLVLVGGEDDGRWLGSALGRMARAALLSPFIRQRVSGLYSRDRREDLAAVSELIEAGKVRAVIDRTYPLVQAADALRYLGQGHPAGKVVLTV